MFDQNMLNELSKLKVDRKAKKSEEDEEYNLSEDDFGDITDEEDAPPETIPLPDHVSQNNSLANLSQFITESAKKEIDPNKFIGETDPDKDFSTEEEEAKAIRIAGRQAAKAYLDESGNELQSRYIDESGDINVVYHSPGKNVVNRKSIEERRLDVKMEALSGLIAKFKTEEEIENEENDPQVVKLDKETAKKEVKRIEQVVNIQNELDIKISMVKNAFAKLRNFVQEKALLPDVGLSVTRPENLRALFEKQEIDEMEISKIFLLSLFLETPENFPSSDTFEQVQYRNNQVGAKPKQIDLKRMITYISSDSEFQRNVEDILAITGRNLRCDGIKEVFAFKCQEALKGLREKYFKGTSTDPLSKVNTISIQKDIQFKYRNIESTKNFIESLKSKVKILPQNFKDQIARTNEQIISSEEKAETIKKELALTEKEITILLLLTIADTGGGYNSSFYEVLPKNVVEEQLTHYGIKTDSEVVQKVFTEGIKEADLNEVLKKR